jgi:hypothetical protein
MQNTKLQYGKMESLKVAVGGTDIYHSALNGCKVKARGL